MKGLPSVREAGLILRPADEAEYTKKRVIIYCGVNRKADKRPPCRR